jgi:hypothetical protein
MAYFVGKVSLDLTLEQAWHATHKTIVPPERITTETRPVAFAAVDDTFGYIYVLHERHSGQVGVRLIVDQVSRIREVFKQYRGSEAIDVLIAASDQDRKLVVKATAAGTRKLDLLRQIAEQAAPTAEHATSRFDILDNFGDDLMPDFAQGGQLPVVAEATPPAAPRLSAAAVAQETRPGSDFDSLFNEYVPPPPPFVAPAPRAAPSSSSRSRKRNRLRPLAFVFGGAVLLILSGVLLVLLQAGRPRQFDHSAFSVSYPGGWRVLPIEEVQVCRTQHGCVFALGQEPFSFAGVAFAQETRPAPTTMQTLELQYWYDLQAQHPSWEIVQQRMTELAGRPALRLDYRVAAGPDVWRLSRWVILLGDKTLFHVLTYAVSGTIYLENEAALESIANQVVIKQ